MTGQEVAKQLSLGVLIAFVAGVGLLIIPADALYLRAGWCAVLAAALGGYLTLMRPAQDWVRNTMWIFCAVLALISIVLLVE